MANCHELIYKGWYQTLIVLCRNPGRLLSELGPARYGATLLILLSCAAAPLVGPLYAVWLGMGIARGTYGMPSDIIDVGAATLWTSVFAAGIPAILWPALLGMKRRRILNLWPSLLLLPPYCFIICCAAWMSIYDLMKRPQYWAKTEHGLARSSRRRASLCPKATDAAPSAPPPGRGKPLAVQLGFR